MRPRRPDQRFLDSLPALPPPQARTTVQVRVLRQVPRLVPTMGVVEGQFTPLRLPLALTSLVVTHPAARFILDPAICHDVRRHAIADLPPLLRLAVPPRRDVVATVDALADLPPDERTLDFALLTHAHWDHVSGLLDLPGLPVVIHRRELDALAGADVPGGVLPALAGRELRSVDLDGPPTLSFAASRDLFGDGSAVLVDLAGHTSGSVGVLLATSSGPILLAGDAAWHSLQISQLRRKPAFPGLLVDADPKQTFRTLHRLHVASRSVQVVPSHDHDALCTLG